MNHIQFSDTEKKHKCYSEREGEWIVFRCFLCDDYERRVHVKTGEMQSHCSPDSFQHRHYGFFIPPGLDADVYVAN